MWKHVIDRLDAAAAPTTATGGGAARVVADLAVLATDPEEPDEGGGEPQDGGEEGEGDDGLELAAGITAGSDVGPVPDTTADMASNELAKVLVTCSYQSPTPMYGDMGLEGILRTYIDQQTERHPPQDAHEDI